MEFSFKGSWPIKPWKVTDEGITYGKGKFLSYDKIFSLERDAPTLAQNGSIKFYYFTDDGNLDSVMLVYRSDETHKAMAVEEAVLKIIHPESKHFTVNGQYVVHCKSCDKLFFYTKADVAAQKAKSRNAVIDSIGSLGGVMSGQTVAANQFIDRAGRSLDSIRDFNKCPYCGSRDIEDYDEEDYNEYLNRTSKDSTSEKDPVEEIKRYKELLDQGILTEEEFQKKKSELLGL